MVRNANVILTEDLVSQGWIYWGGGGVGMDLLGGGCYFSFIKQKIIRDKMRFSNLSNNMMISEL